MNRLVLIFLSIFYLLNTSQCQEFPCPSLDGYDIKNLTIPEYWQFDLDGDYCIKGGPDDTPCHFYFTFCKFLPKTEGSNCVNSSVCQYQTDASALVEVGHYVDNPFVPKPTNGFYAKFSGSEITILGKRCNISVIFDFECNKNAPWIPESGPSAAPKPVSDNFNYATCEIEVLFDYAGACHKIDPATTTNVNPTPAKICIPPKGYDITPLTIVPYWVFHIPGDCQIEQGSPDICSLYMSFCKPIEDGTLIGCTGSSGCIRYPNLGGSLIVANYTEDPFTAFEKNGFLAEYPHGKRIINRFTGKQCDLEIELEFVCDKAAIWQIPSDNKPGDGPEPIAFQSITENSCKIKMAVPYSGACKKEKNKDKGLSGGSVLLILFFVFVATYLGLGYAYNTFIKNEIGLNRIPNFSFWSSAMLFTLEGFIFTWRFVTCQRSKDKLLKYDSI